LTLLLTALLAWPWNVVLSAAESFQVATQVRLGTDHAEGNRRLPTIVRHGWWNQPSCSGIAPDYDCDEEEGDDGDSFSPSSFLSSIHVLTCADVAASSSASPVLLVRILSGEPRCHLRC